MELKHNNCNGEIVVANKLSLVELFVESCEMVLKSESYKLFFQEDTYIA